MANSFFIEQIITFTLINLEDVSLIESIQLL